MIHEYIKHLEVNRGLSANTLRAYDADLRKFAKWATQNISNARWSTITKQDVETYVQALVATGAQRTSIRREVSAIRSFYWHQVRAGRLANNPAQYVSSPKTERRLPHTIPVSDIREALNDKQADTQTLAIVAVIAETGARISEVLGMKWEDVDKHTQTIRLHGKGSKERVVRYGQRTAAALNIMDNAGRGLLFTKKCERNYRYDVWQLMRRHTEAEKCSAHIIRHAFACAHMAAGTDIKTLATMMGHESVKTTEIYAQVAGARLLQSFNNIQV